MKTIEKLEALKESKTSPFEQGINPSFYWAYHNTRRSGLELLNFGEMIWEVDLPEIIKLLDEYGIDRFTISSTFSGLVPLLYDLDEQGFRVAGTTQIESYSKNPVTDEPESIPALIMIRCFRY